MSITYGEEVVPEFEDAGGLQTIFVPDALQRVREDSYEPGR